MADQLATPDDLALLLERADISVSTDKAILLIECATAVIQAVTSQRIVWVEDDEITIDLDALDRGRQYLDLPEQPVTAVTAVTINGMAVQNWRLSRGRVWRPYGWHLPREGMWVDMPYQAGFVYSHGLPVGHQQLQLARSSTLGMIKSAYSNPTGATRIQIDDYLVHYEALAGRMEQSPGLAALLRRQYSRPPRSAVLTH